MIEEAQEGGQTVDLAAARKDLFHKLGELIGAINDTLVAEPGYEGNNFLWRRDDGVSLTFATHGINEIRLLIQCPADEALDRFNKLMDEVGGDAG